jgi:hypothetical protein
MIITSYMHKIIQIHPCLLKLSRKQESVMDGHSRYYYIHHRYRGGIITSHMQEIIQIYPCLLKLWRIMFCMWLVIIIILDVFLHGNIWNRVFGENLSFWLKITNFENCVLFAW